MTTFTASWLLIFATGWLAEPGLKSGERSAAPTVRFEVAFEGLRFHRPVFVTHPGDGTDRLFVVEQGGRVLRFNNDQEVRRAEVSVDLRRRVGRGNNEEGLLGFAFHPDFKENGRVFLHFTAARGERRNVLSEFHMDPVSGVINARSERVVLEVAQPWGNHNGGMIAFGPDGFLYVSLGDGGAGGDPKGSGQDKGTLLGSILRIDVDERDSGLGYAVPGDNPFVDEAGSRGEIWAYGLRNAWRFSFDRLTGELWAGDVGQDHWEEIDVIVKGGNYGWNVWEGNHRFERGWRRFFRGGGAPDRRGYQWPVAEHRRGEAKSITGGYVYRGRRVPGAEGVYVYGDFVTGLVWGLRHEDGRVVGPEFLGRVPGIASFGEDRDGELYVTSFDGRLYMMLPG